MHKCGIYFLKKVQMNLFSGQKKRHRCREGTCGRRGGRRMWGELGKWH